MFKERVFVLERDHLFYFKDTKDSKENLALISFRGQELQLGDSARCSSSMVRLFWLIKISSTFVHTYLFKQNMALHNWDHKWNTQVYSWGEVVIWLLAVVPGNFRAYWNAQFQLEFDKELEDLSELGEGSWKAGYDVNP